MHMLLLPMPLNQTKEPPTKAVLLLAGTSRRFQINKKGTDFSVSPFRLQRLHRRFQIPHLYDAITICPQDRRQMLGISWGAQLLVRMARDTTPLVCGGHQHRHCQPRCQPRRRPETDSTRRRLGKLHWGQRRSSHTLGYWFHSMCTNVSFSFLRQIRQN